jgi:hypothetical protein
MRGCIEAVCAQYRDSVLVLDDIEQAGSHVIISFVYLIANEKGGSRMTPKLRLRTPIVAGPEVGRSG